MSRGPGKWQRVILEALEVEPAWYVNTLLPANFTRSEYVALLRAANTLARKGKIDLLRYQCWGLTPGQVVVKRPDYDCHRDKVASLNVDKVAPHDLVNT